MKLLYEIEDSPVVAIEEEEILFNRQEDTEEDYLTYIVAEDETDKNDESRLFTYNDRKYSKLNINYVLSPASNKSAAIKLKPTGKSKILIPYQTSGLATAPGDIPNGYRKNFWERLFETFFKFLTLPFQLAYYTWEYFTKSLVGNGAPENMSKAWISESVLYQKKSQIHFKNNPLVPADVMPAVPYRRGVLSSNQTGLGLFIRNSGQLRQYIDPNRNLKRSINYRYLNNNSPGWRVPPYADEIRLTWLSNDYGSNDGAIYGSFALLEEY